MPKVMEVVPKVMEVVPKVMEVVPKAMETWKLGGMDYWISGCLI